MLPKIFIFLISSACLVTCDSSWSDGDNWIEASLKASSFYNQLPSSQQNQLENIADSDQLTESQIMQQLSQYGNNQLQGNQRQQFSQWLQQLAQQNLQFMQQARLIFNGLGSQAQPYGQQILQVLQNQNINPNQEDDQVNNIIRNSPSNIRNELLNAWNQLQQYQLQQTQQTSGVGFSFNNDMRTMGTGYSGGYGNYAYNQNARNGYRRDQYGQGQYSQSQYGYGQGSQYRSQYNQGYPNSRYTSQYFNGYSSDSTGFPLPPGLGEYSANSAYTSQYGQQGYKQPSYGQSYTNSYSQGNGYGQVGYGQRYGQGYGQSRQSANSNYGYR
uniref:Uncharacterized protein n=1 Tax=Acrobeloides nanus TaxID=290746 RepID=A0A914CLF3_9BILA